MKFDTIEQIEAHEFAGNYRDDAEAFNAIDKFCAIAKPTDLLRAANHMSVKGMGLPALDERRDLRWLLNHHQPAFRKV